MAIMGFVAVIKKMKIGSIRPKEVTNNEGRSVQEEDREIGLGEGLKDFTFVSKP